MPAAGGASGLGAETRHLWSPRGPEEGSGGRGGRRPVGPSVRRRGARAREWRRPRSGCRGGVWAGGLHGPAEVGGCAPGRTPPGGIPGSLWKILGARPFPAATGFRTALLTGPPRFCGASKPPPGPPGREDGGACRDPHRGRAPLGRGASRAAAGQVCGAQRPRPSAGAREDQVSSILPAGSGRGLLAPVGGRGEGGRDPKPPDQPGAAGWRLCPSDLRGGGRAALGAWRRPSVPSGPALTSCSPVAKAPGRTMPVGSPQGPGALRGRLRPSHHAAGHWHHFRSHLWGCFCSVLYLSASFAKCFFAVGRCCGFGKGPQVLDVSSANNSE